MVNKECIVCGSAFRAKTDREDSAKYCSHDCRMSVKKDKGRVYARNSECLRCHKVFMAGVDQRRKHCSHQCSKETEDRIHYLAWDFCFLADPGKNTVKTSYY